MHNIRLSHLQGKAADLYTSGERISLKDDKITKDLLIECMSASAEAIAELLKRSAEGGKVKGFKRGVIPFMGYLIAHEAHHRGNILLTLKQCGHALPKEISYGIWD